MIFNRHASIIGISLEPGEVEICRLRREGKQVGLAAHVRGPVPAGVFKNDPVRAGQELRALLHESRIRPERCVVCLPLNWAFLSELDLPDLSEADLQGFIRLEAERRFPLSPDDLVLAVSYRGGTQEGRRALLAAVPAEYLANVGKALRAARLRPVSITFGMDALAAECAGTGLAVVSLGKGFVDLAVAGGGGFPLLKNLVWQEDPAQENLPPDVREMTRQLRIALAQLAPERRESVKSAAWFGCGEWPEESVASLTQSCSGLGIALERGTAGALDGSGVSRALLAGATRVLSGPKAGIDFHTKQKAQLKSITARLSGRNIRSVIAAAGAVIFLVAAAFSMQGRELSQLEDQWAEISPQVKAAKGFQDQVRKYRPWFDNSVPSLSIPKSLAQAFPEGGTVWLKSLRIKDRTFATCTGSASNRSDWMSLLEKLGKDPGLDNLQVVQARGDAPISFTFTFRRKGAAVPAYADLGAANVLGC